MFDKLFGMLKRQGPQALIDAAIKLLPHELHETTFAIATDLEN
ncbi:MAG: hypothetical protein QNJ68_02850 [Microcoleaceae cyanobacterium MO_207.B10]|nr:hypothetical protein [Microcoleaceae cyanobacterium MO_207.B10]